MKNAIDILKKTSLYVGIFALSLGLNSCSDDDDGTVDIPDTDDSISAQAQIVTQNEIVIDEIIVDDDSWIVVRKVDEEGNPGEIVNNPEMYYLEDGTHTNVMVALDNSSATGVSLEDGDNLIITLHEDDDDREFEWEGDSGADGVITDNAGNPIAATVEITQPSLTWSDPVVDETGVVFGNISTNQDGWVVLHNANPDGGISDDEIIGYQYVATGENPELTVTWEEGFTYTPGQAIYSRFYMDDPADEAFTYLDNAEEDVPFIFGFDTDNTISGQIEID